MRVAFTPLSDLATISIMIAWPMFLSPTSWAASYSCANLSDGFACRNFLWLSTRPTSDKFFRCYKETKPKLWSLKTRSPNVSRFVERVENTGVRNFSLSSPKSCFNSLFKSLISFVSFLFSPAVSFSFDLAYQNNTYTPNMQRAQNCHQTWEPSSKTIHAPPGGT